MWGLPILPLVSEFFLPLGLSLQHHQRHLSPEAESGKMLAPGYCLHEEGSVRAWVRLSSCTPVCEQCLGFPKPHWRHAVRPLNLGMSLGEGSGIQSTSVLHV